MSFENEQDAKQESNDKKAQVRAHYKLVFSGKYSWSSSSL